MPHPSIIEPAIALVAWTLFMWLWMYVKRIPAIKASGMELDPYKPNGEQMATLPAQARWKADNYNHLLEQPTIFYAIVFALAFLGEGDGINALLAWAYVGLRIVHSIFQATVNVIVVRFLLFALSNIPLIALTANAVCAII